MSRMTRILLPALAGLVTAAGLVSAAPYVIRSDGSRVEGTAIVGKPNGEITLTTANGTLTFLPGQYSRAVADKPAQYDAIAAAVSQGRELDKAIPALEEIIRRHPNLTWDVAAGEILLFAHLSKGQPKEAMEWAERIKRANQAAFDLNPDLEKLYWRAMLEDGQNAKLEGLLTEAITKGSRDRAARAQVLRGDMLTAQKKYKEAALDYLRTIILFEAQEKIQPEALLKAAQTFETLKESERAKSMYQRLGRDFSTSREAIQAREAGKL